MTRRIVVVGSYLTGVAMRVSAFPKPGQTIIATGVERSHGGKGSNQAIQAARCGAPVDLLSAVGLDEAGNHAARQWASDGVDSLAVERSADAATGIGFILVNRAGENQIVIDPGATARCSASFVLRRAEKFRDAAVVLTQLEIPVDGARAALTVGRQSGAQTVLNPAPSEAPLAEEFWPLVDYVVANEGEAEALCGTGNVAANGRALAARVGVAAVVTAGAAGGFVFHRDGTAWRVLAPHVEVEDTTGGGDAFCGALVAALSRRTSLDHAVRQGIAAGSLACTRAGVVPALHGHAAISDLANTLSVEAISS